MATMDDLSEHLLLYIISFLPTRDAVRTSLISRKWRNLWPSLSSLDLDFHLFPPIDSFQETRRLFIEFVNHTLIGRRSSSGLHKFRLRFFLTYTENRIYNHVESWIRYAINHDVLELDLDFQAHPNFNEFGYDHHYAFCLSALRNSCVRVLNLRDCDIISEFDLTLPSTASTTSILSLQSISLAEIFLSDDVVSALILECVNLESLVIEDCVGVENLKIRSSKLKKLSLSYSYRWTGDTVVPSVEICAPNLCKMSIIRVEMGKFSLQDSSSLVEAHVWYKMKHFCYWSKVVRLLSGVKRLKTQNRWFELVASKDVLSRCFNNLSHLVLETGYTKNDLLGLAAFLELCPNLKTMILDSLYQTDEDEMLPKAFISRIKLRLPSLKRVKMENSRGTRNELALRVLLKDQGVVLEKVELIPAKVDESGHFLFDEKLNCFND